MYKNGHLLNYDILTINCKKIHLFGQRVRDEKRRYINVHILKIDTIYTIYSINFIE